MKTRAEFQWFFGREKRSVFWLKTISQTPAAVHVQELVRVRFTRHFCTRTRTPSEATPSQNVSCAHLCVLGSPWTEAHDMSARFREKIPYQASLSIASSLPSLICLAPSLNLVTRPQRFEASAQSPWLSGEALR